MIARYPGGIVPVLIPHGDPLGHKHVIEAGVEPENRNTGGREQPPLREPGDKYVIICTVAGMCVGCAAGIFLGYGVVGLTGAIIGAVLGAVIGGTIGATAGSYLKKRTGSPRKIKNQDETGPFIR